MGAKQTRSIINRYQQFWNWGYRHSAFGGREQKRLLFSSQSDELEHSHNWTYYLKGAYGEELAVFYGRQYNDQSAANAGACFINERTVKFYGARYYSDGGNLSILANQTREYLIKDHLGSVRAVVAKTINAIEIRHSGYKPFGDSLYTSGREHNRHQGYEAMERDPESQYINMGARLYDPVIGRFLSVDTPTVWVWEGFRSFTPYHYAYNSPISYKDPSGLAPKKEKGDRVMGYTVYEPYIQVIVIDEQAFRAELYDWLSGLENFNAGIWALFKAQNNGLFAGIGTPGGGSSKVDRTGAWEVSNDWTSKDANGLTFSDKYSEFYKKRSQEAVANGELYDCMDFQLKLLFEFAMENSLPLNLTKRDGTVVSYQDYDNSDDFWSSISTLLARDLIVNTTPILFEDKIAGDMRLMRQGNQYHVVGYNGTIEQQISYGNHINGVPISVRNNHDWTIMNRYIERMKIEFITGYRNGVEQYNVGYVLRWNFQKIGGK